MGSLSSSGNLTLPYAHLNLRCNPFGQLTRPEKNALSVLRLDIEPLIERLRKPGYALQFLKEGARNKTTHLLAIRRSFPGAPYIRLHDGMPIPDIPEASVLFIDWMHLMPRVQRQELLKRNAAFGIVSHVNHGHEFRKAGLNHELIRLPCYNSQQLREQVERRIAWAQRDESKPVPSVSLETIDALLRQYGDDTVVIDHLYDVFEDLEEVGDVRILS